MPGQPDPARAPFNGKGALELRLAQELKAAYDCHRAEQGLSERRFLSSIAALYEREECDGSAIATSLRELGTAEGGSTGPLRHLAAKTEKAYLTEDEQSLLTSAVSAAGPLNEDPLALEAITVDPCGEASPPAHEHKLLHNATSTFQDVDDEDMEQVRQLFEIPKCPFIDVNGKIRHIPSEWEAIAGPCLRHFYESLTHWCFQPMKPGLYLRFVQGSVFKTVGALVILLNFFFIICQSDYQIWAEINKDPEKEASWMKVAEVVFTGYYMFELTCLIIAYRKDFFLGPDMSWNWFDFIIVLTGATELLMTVLGGTMANLSFLRVLRFFKLSRVLRMFSALRMVKDVKIMVDALTGSFVIFIFGCMLLSMFLAVFSIFFVQGLSSFLEAEVSVDPILRQTIIDDFGSVATAMRSLFMSVTGGDDWSKYHNTIKMIGPAYDYLYLFFMAFALIAFFNVITGVFAEKAMSLASPTIDEMSKRRQDNEVKDAQELVNLLDRVLKKPSHISADAFGDLMSHPEVVSFFEARGLKATTAHRFFVQLLEINQTDNIDIGTFVSACVKLDGVASSIDVHVISVEMKTVLMQQHALQETLNRSLQHISASVARQLSACNSAAQGSALTHSTESALVQVSGLPQKDALPGLFSGLPELGKQAPVDDHDIMFAKLENSTQVTKTANVKLSRAAGGECADALLSTCCEGVGRPEDDGTLESTNSGSHESEDLARKGDLARFFVL